jgi:DNA-binding transcriptional LysR family regulator
MDRFDAMKTLLAAVDGGSLSAAGRALNMPLPTVSRKVSELEAHLGARLLIRSTRQLTLTDAGVAYVAAARRLLEQLADAERAAAGEYVTPRGELSVTAPMMFGRLHVLPAVNAFLKRYPEVKVRLSLSDSNVHLIEDHVDVAVRIGALPDSALVASRVGFVRRVICASPAFLAEHGEPSRPEALAALPCVAFEGPGGNAFWTFRDGRSRARQIVPVNQRLVVNSTDAALEAAVAGIGVTCILSYQVAQAVAGGRLKIILADHETDPLPVHLVYPGQAMLPLKTRAFLDVAGAELRASIAASA